MPTLSEELAAMGLSPEPCSPPAYATPADDIRAIVEPVLVSINHAVKPLPWALSEALELHVALEHMTIRLEYALATHGHKLVKKVDSPQVESGHTFGGKPMLEHCKHHLVDVDDTASYLTCRACKTLVNPIWWLHRHARDVTNAESARRSLRQEAGELRDEIEKLKKERSKHRQAVKRAVESKRKTH